MYRCDDCSHIFGEDDIVIRAERVGLPTDSLPPGYLYYDTCPNCGCDDITGVELCMNCGKVSDKTYCEECIELANKCIDQLRKSTNGDDVEGLLEDIING